MAAEQNDNTGTDGTHPTVYELNEELRVFNEELEASREELQSLNEDLLAANQQLDEKNHELQKTNDDLTNLLASTGIATLFLDRQFRIRRFTPALTGLIRLLPGDTGRLLTDIATYFTDDDVLSDAAQVLDGSGPLEKEIYSTCGRWYLRRVLPYISGDNQIDGVVITFTDTTARKLRGQRQEFLLRFYDTLRPLQQPDDIILNAARLTGEFFSAMRCAYGVIDGLQTTVTIEHDYKEGDISWSGDYRFDDWDPDILQQLRNGQPLQIEDGAHDRRLPDIAKTRFATEDLGALLLVPFCREQQQLQMLFAVGHGRPRHWLPEEVELISQMLERTWLALEKAQADQVLLASKLQLEQQAQQLLENERHKNEFLSILGHELRNPLGAIHNTLQVLALQAEQNGQGPQPPAILERQVQHMHRLIDDLLDISRINAGKIELRRQPVSMADCVTTAVETLQPMIDAGGHKLSISLPRQPLWLDGDPVRLVQVLENLLMNAAKYSSQGGRIALKVERRGDHAVIRVRDNGIGISSIDLQSVFGMFAQSRAAQKHPSDGLGLGLALVKQLVELHDGQVEAFSEGPECGSEFVVTLPLLHAASLPAAGGHSATAAAVPAAAVAVLPRRILIIDDNADNADSLTALLTALGHQTRAIYTGLAALTTVHRFEPECVFIDLSMPDMDGFEVARQLRHEYPVGTIVLIALSGYGSDDDIDTARAAGFDHHLLKPAGLDEITDLLASLR